MQPISIHHKNINTILNWGLNLLETIRGPSLVLIGSSDRESNDET